MVYLNPMFLFAELVILTGTSSGLGKKAALALLRSGDCHVIGAVRDLDKMQAVAEESTTSQWTGSLPCTVK